MVKSMTTARFTVTVPAALDEAIREQCGPTGKSKSDFINEAIAEKLERCAPDYAPPDAPGLAELEADRDRLKAEASAAADQARTAAAEASRAREDLAARDQLLEERADEIRWLRGEVSKLNDKLTPIGIPEKAGPSAGTVEAAGPIAVPASEAAPPRPPGPPMPARRPWPLGWWDEIRGRGPAA